ncbi:tRNA 4-thiouridine(8) synthase ThiI, partial [Vibrio parahaemolyticus]|nr:tRNA 4-thiouridine(8) synthase ThiI [Vibrio parahaemolyticus]
NEVTNTPIIRPVATMDKLEIIEVAEQIDTFELSVQPFEDCCTIFAPPQPKTRPRHDKVHQYEERLPIEEMIERALSGLKMETIHTATEAEQVEEFADLL